jgi:FkbM family methyltransferase
MCHKEGTSTYFQKFLSRHIRFIKEYGLWKALVSVIFVIISPLFVPRRDMKIKLRNYDLFIVPNDFGISTELRLFAVHEPMTSKVLVEELRKRSNREITVIDIGSNIGYYAVLESKLVGARGRVIAVEPNPTAFSYLLRNIKLNKLTNVVAIKKAIGATDDTAKMLIKRETNWSRILQTDEGFRVGTRDIIRVETVTLDTLVKQLGLKSVDLIRMDVEGFEYYVIKGSKNVIEKYLPDILMEIHPYLMVGEHFTVMLWQLKNKGYECKYFIPRAIDYPLVYRDGYIVTKKIDELILKKEVPDVFSLYLSARLD